MSETPRVKQILGFSVLVHSENSYECTVCSRIFTKNGMPTHIWRKHGEGRSHKPRFGKPGHSWNKGLTKETDPRVAKIASTLSVRNKENPFRAGKKHTSETKQRLSKLQSQRILDGDAVGMRNIPYHKVENLRGEIFSLRGSFEKRLAEKLNSLGIIWTSRHQIEYVWNGVKRLYHPDILLEDSQLYIEVKGYFTEYDKEKMRALRDREIEMIGVAYLRDIEALEKDEIEFDEFCVKIRQNLSCL